MTLLAGIGGLLLLPLGESYQVPGIGSRGSSDETTILEGDAY